jgi:hypothetical protein
MSVLFSTAYFPPVGFLKIAKNNKYIILEANETYIKQTYRNRCEILSANGVLALTIPVIKPNGNHTLIKDIRIDNNSKWRKEHWRAIESWGFLWDFNKSIICTVIDLLELDIRLAETNAYEKSPASLIDYRNTFSPKNKGQVTDDDLQFEKYYQVFGNRYGFTPNLSAIDLICNCGMESVLLL